MDKTLEWLSNLTLDDRDETRDETMVIDEMMAIDLDSDESSSEHPYMNFIAKKRSETSIVTPKRFTTQKPRGVSSPKKVPVPCRRLDF